MGLQNLVESLIKTVKVIITVKVADITVLNLESSRSAYGFDGQVSTYVICAFM